MTLVHQKSNFCCLKNEETTEVHKCDLHLDDISMENVNFLSSYGRRPRLALPLCFRDYELQMIMWHFIDSLKVYDTGTMLILEKKKMSLTGYWTTSMQLKLGFWLIFWMTEVISTYPTKTSTGLQTTNNISDVRRY